MERILKPHRIIPNELYVQRDADRQLKSILDEMASPGYVLVSRQMGKTNLLLHAKNSFQRENDVFIYFDLSNPFNNEFECFRAVIDKAIDTNIDLIGHLIPKVKEIRAIEYPAHIEHLQELRLILKSITGKVVIIYDEIDALTRASFSDKIFSQIRSIYFDRDNYKELERLTYILSGVMEPTEIIKDPKISPFNIGLKIFLDDFSLREHQAFVTKAQLAIPDEISNRIFYWTSGNPRMTYDICSEIELFLMEHKLIQVQDVDDVIKSLYLSTFDKAPVDHIRELVEHDKEIRDALLVIRYGKGDEITHSTKTKLYLAGIVSSNFTKQIKIKNKIIGESLNENWVKNIDKKQKNVNKLIEERTANTEFLAVIDIFTQHDEVNDDKLSNTSFFNIGLSYYKTASFDKAVELFSKVSYDRIYEKSYYLEAKFLLAESFSYTSQQEKAIELFREIIVYDDGGKYYYPSKLYLAKTLTELNFKENSEEASNLYEEILNNLKKVEHELDEGYSLTITISVHLYYGMLLAMLEKIDEAKEQYNKALSIAKPINIPQILLQLYKLQVDSKEKIATLEEIVKVVTDEKLVPNKDSDTYPYFSNNILYSIFREIFYSNSKLFSGFCEYILRETEKFNEEYGEMLYNIGAYGVQQNEIDFAVAVFDYLIFRSKRRVNSVIIQSCYQFCFKALPDIEIFYKKYSEGYAQFLFSNNDVDINFMDFTILLPLVDKYLEQEDSIRAQNIISLLKISAEKFDNNLKSTKYILDFFEIKTLYSSQLVGTATQKSRDLLKNLENLTDFEINSNPFLKSSYNDLKMQLYALLPRSEINISHPINRLQHSLPKDTQRVDVKFKNGTIKSNVRFKKVKEDVNRGVCEIIKTY